MMLDAQFPLKEADELIQRALAEDVGPGDATTLAVVPEDALGRASVVARQDGVLAGLPALGRVFARLDDRVTVHCLLQEGAVLEPGSAIAVIEGPSRALLTG